MQVIITNQSINHSIEVNLYSISYNEWTEMLNVKTEIGNE